MPDNSVDYNQHLNTPIEPTKEDTDQRFEEFKELEKDPLLVDPDHNGTLARAHEINLELIEVIKYRNSKKWWLSFGLVFILFLIIFLMMVLIAFGIDVMEGWKEVLLVLLGAFVASFSKLIDFWFNNQEADNQLLIAAQDNDK